MDISNLKIGATLMCIVYKESNESLIGKTADGMILSFDWSAANIKEGDEGYFIRKTRGRYVFVTKKVSLP